MRNRLEYNYDAQPMAVYNEQQYYTYDISQSISVRNVLKEIILNLWKLNKNQGLF